MTARRQPRDPTVEACRTYVRFLLDRGYTPNTVYEYARRVFRTLDRALVMELVRGGLDERRQAAIAERLRARHGGAR